MSIQANTLTKRYGTQIAINKVSFEIRKKEIVGFIGPNGAGKSTTMKILCGLLQPDEGSALIDGLDIAKSPLDVKRILGYLPENNPLYDEMYVLELLDFMARINKINNKSVVISKLLEQTGLGKEKHKKIAALSKGYKQRVGLAQALIADPEVLILDEPTTGLDPNQIIEIRNLISAIGREKTVMLSTHIMQEVEAICQRVIIIDNGVIQADQSTADIKTMSGDNQVVRIEFDKEIDKQQLLSLGVIKDLREISNLEYILQTNEKEDIRPKLFQFAIENKVTILSLQKENKSLEEVFHLLTNKNN